MSESEQTDHWKSLATKVGAELPAEIPQTKVDASRETTDERPSHVQPPAASGQPHQPKTRPAAPLRQNHWGLLAGELGIEVATKQPTQDEVYETRPTSQQVDDRVQDVAPPVASVKPAEEFREPLSTISETEREEAEIPLFLEESQEAIHDSFFDEEAATERMDDSPELADSITSDLGDESGSPDAAKERTGDDSERRPRRRRRRRRRGSRTPQAESREAEARKAEAPVADVDDSDADDLVEDVLEGDDEDADEEVSADTETGGQDRSDSQKHTKIPTWEEAIGVVVSANMEGRSKSSADSGRRDRGRGRGRGGR